MLLRLAKLCKLISIFEFSDSSTFSKDLEQRHFYLFEGLNITGIQYSSQSMHLMHTDFSRFAQYLMVSCNVVCQISRVLKHKIVDDNFVKFPQFVVTGFYRLKNLCPSLFLRNCVSRILFLYPNMLRDCCQLTWCNMFLQMFLVTLSFPAFCWPHPNFWTCVTVMKLRMNKYFTCTL